MREITAFADLPVNSSTLDSPVTFHVAPSANAKVTLPADALLFIAPVSVVPLFKIMEMELMSLTLTSPFNSCSSAVKTKCPPFFPVRPQRATPAETSTPSFETSFAFFKLIFALVFVMKNTGPEFAVRLPPSMSKTLVPTPASPEKL